MKIKAVKIADKIKPAPEIVVPLSICSLLFYLESKN
jgi:hypothetical protein